MPKQIDVVKIPNLSVFVDGKSVTVIPGTATMTSRLSRLHHPLRGPPLYGRA